MIGFVCVLCSVVLILFPWNHKVYVAGTCLKLCRLKDKYVTLPLF
jgi:hypothetical protein